MGVDDLTERMLLAGKVLASDIWTQIESFAIPEINKIAIQIKAIAEHRDEYSLQGCKALLDMQVRASVGVIVAMTSLTLLIVQNAVNSIIESVGDIINSFLGFELI